MKSQLSFAASEYAGKKKATRRERFHGEMEKVVPWGKLIELIGPYYPKGERGRPPIGIERMLRIYFLAQWYGLADEAMEDAIYDSQAMRNFIGVDLGGKSVHADAGYLGVEKRGEFHGRVIDWQIAGKRGKIRAMAEGLHKDLLVEWKRRKAQIRSRVDPPFHIVKTSSNNGRFDTGG